MSHVHAELLFSQVRIYQHSGRLGHSLLVMPVAGVVGAVVFGTIFGYATAYNPFHGGVAIAYSAVCGLGLGFAVGYAFVWSRCRSPKFALLAAVVIALLTLYCGFTVLVYAVQQRGGNLMGRSPIDLFASPSDTWRALAAINVHGWETRAGQTTGLAAWTYWGGEALLLLALTIAIVNEVLMRHVYCDCCEQWCPLTRKGMVFLQHPRDGAQLIQIERGDLTPLASLSVTSAQTIPSLRLDLWECRRCWDFVVLGVNEMLKKQVGRDREKLVAKMIGKRLIITPNLRDWLTDKARPAPVSRSEPSV